MYLDGNRRIFFSSAVNLLQVGKSAVELQRVAFRVNQLALGLAVSAEAPLLAEDVVLSIVAHNATAGQRNNRRHSGNAGAPIALIREEVILLYSLIQCFLQVIDSRAQHGPYFLANAFGRISVDAEGITPHFFDVQMIKRCSHVVQSLPK